MEVHGVLAPKKDFARKINDDDSENNANYYNLNDSFIDDAEAENKVKDQFFDVKLGYGEYSAEEIIKNMRKKRKFARKRLSSKENSKTVLSEFVLEKPKNSKEVLSILKRVIPLYKKSKDKPAFLEELRAKLEISLEEMNVTP